MGLPPPARELDLRILQNGCPAITEYLGGCLAETAAVCLEERGHGLRVLLDVVTNGCHVLFDLLRPEVTDGRQIRRSDDYQLDAYVVVVLFGLPMAKVIKDEFRTE